jgi:hypothetical protein
METTAIMEEIEKLSLTKKFYVLEETLRFIKKEEIKQQMKRAATDLYDDYATDKALKAFTILDVEDFYEAK